MYKQVEMITLADLVAADHIYRKFVQLIDIRRLDNKYLKTAQGSSNYKGYGIELLFKALLLQHLEDLSDRELASYLTENTAAKWFCNVALTAPTPDHTVFTRARARIGTHQLSKIFADVRAQLQQHGYMNEVFTCIDASHLIAKANLWEERDRVIQQKYAKLNNEVLPKVATDKQARIGCKGNGTFWYGYKKHIGVDMQSGLINKVAITPANVTDGQGIGHVIPTQGAMYADKGYCSKGARHAAAKKRCHLAAIKKNNMKDKNKDQDTFFSKLRSPYERVFSKTNHRVRYVGEAKNQFAIFLESLAFNLKRQVVLDVKYGGVL